MWIPRPDGEADAPGVWQDDWVVTFHADLVASPGGGPATSPVTIEPGSGGTLDVAEAGPALVVFAGQLTNARELEARGESAAATVAALLAARGADACGDLRGSFAVMAWDAQRRRLVVARDHVGLQPLFVARSGPRWFFAASPRPLVAKPGVSRAIDAVALSEWLCGWYPAIEDTAFRDVKRVPPATIMVIGEGSVEQRRYWDPAPITDPVAWSREEDLDMFDGLLAQAVRRVLGAGAGPSGIFLSGGVDSIAVAATATDIARESGQDGPLALSLVFPDAASNEETIQAGVAERLGLRQHLVPLAEAAGAGGLLASAVALSEIWPQPMLNLWAPAYMHLAGIGRQEGARLILTGRGGDEWLTVTPYVMADYVRQGNVAGIWQMLAAWQRAHQGGVREAGRVLWRTAGRPLGSAVFDGVAPRRWHARRRQRLLGERPAWVAPDPAIRAAMDARVDRWIDPARPPQGFYVREMRTALLHPAVSHDMEETHEFGRRNGQRVAHPFWDVDLVNALYRVPPALLMKDGRSKWLLRRRLGARFPGLGLERRVKVSARSVFQDLMEQQAPAAWKRLGGVGALADAGVVSSSGVESALVNSSSGRWAGSGRFWTLLSFESWARAWAR